MRLAIVTEFLSPLDQPLLGGVDARTRALALELARRHDVHLVAARPAAGADPPGPYEVHRVGRPRGLVQRSAFADRLRFQAEAAREAARLRPDAVEGSGFVAYRPALRAQALCGSPAVLTVHEVWQGQWRRNMGLLNGAIGSVLERRLLNGLLSGAVCVSQATADRLRAVRRRPVPTAVVPNGVSRGFLAMRRRPAPPDAPLLLAVSRLVDYKRLDLAVAAVAALRPAFPGVRLAVVGEGPAKPALQAQAARAGVADAVRFLGRAPQEEVEGLYRSASLLLHPSPVEGFCMVVAEAMACGLPYVAADVPALRETTRGGLGGRLAAPGDGTGFTAAVGDLLAAPPSTREARAVALQEWEWGRLAARLEGFLEGVRRPAAPTAPS